MRAALVLLTASLLTSCGLIPSNPEVDPEFSILYAEFLADAAHYGRELDLWDLRIEFAEMPLDIAGRCRPNKTVEINPEVWAFYDRWDREILIYHELGHCLLGQDHRPDSIMSQNLRTTWYAWHREEYKAELFTYKERY